MSAVYINRLGVPFECPNGERSMSRVYKHVQRTFHISLMAESSIGEHTVCAGCAQAHNKVFKRWLRVLV